MFVTIHAAMAVALTQGVSSPLLAGAIGFASHLALDMVPHGDDVLGDRLRARGWTRLKIGLVFGLPDLIVWTLGLGWYLSTQHPAHPTAAFAAAFGAVLPDLMWGLATFVPWRWLKAFDRFHERSHRLLGKNLLPAWAGFSVQALTLAIALASLL